MSVDVNYNTARTLCVLYFIFWVTKWSVASSRNSTADSSVVTSTSFLFMYLTQQQRRLQSQCGDNGDNVYLDSTCRTAVCELHLFMLAVLTNTEYQNIGFIVIENLRVWSLRDCNMSRHQIDASYFCHGLWGIRDLSASATFEGVIVVTYRHWTLLKSYT